MSTLKVNEVRHLSNSGTENIKLESNGTTTLQATSTLGLTVTGTLNVSGLSTFTGNVVVGDATTDTVDLKSKVTGFNNFSGFTGEIRMYSGNEGPDAPPTGWLYCNGDTISQLTGHSGTHYNADGKGNDYEALFNLLKTNSNWGNSGSPSWGADAVKLPDFRSRSPVGVHTGAANALPTGLTARTIGIGTSIADGSTLVGKETHALTIAELAVHTHASTIVANSTGVDQGSHTHSFAHTHNLSAHTHTSAAHTHSSAAHSHDMNSHVHGLNSHYHNVPQNTTAAGSPHRHKSAVEGYADFTQANGNNATANSSLWHWTDYESAHTHTVPAINSDGPNTSNTQGPDPGNTATVTPGNTGSTTPGVTGTPSANVTAGQSTSTTGSTDPAITDPTHTHTLTAVSTGSGTAHTILSPIIAVNYIIKV